MTPLALLSTKLQVIILMVMIMRMGLSIKADDMLNSGVMMMMMMVSLAM